MKTYKVFEARELEDALEEKGLAGDILFDLFTDFFCNDCAVHWRVEQSTIPEDDIHEKAINIINEYMINQGCALDERVYIDVTW